MRWVALLVAVIGASIVGWAIVDKLSADALGMAIGMALGVLAGVPAAALVLVATRGGSGGDGWDGPIVDGYAAPSPALLPGGGLPPDEWPSMSVFAEDVTPYYRLARRMMQMPALPSRREEIAQMRAVLDEMVRQEVR